VPDRSILGVEATNAGTTAVLVRDGEIVSRQSEGTLDVLLDPHAFERLTNMITESGAIAAGLGLAGIHGVTEATRVEAMLRAKTGIAVTVGDDAETALLSHDGRGPSAPALEDAITSAYGLDLDGVARHIHESSRDIGAVARIARLVMSLDHPVMQAILDQAITDLIGHAQALRRRLGPLPVAMHGSVFAHREVRARFVAATDAVDPARPPEYGAVLLATSAHAGRDMGWHSK
jgi:glucosamine kinase